MELGARENERPRGVAMTTRVSRDIMYFDMAIAAAKRGTCQRKKIGTVIVVERGIIVVGYNGSPPGQPHCIDVGCLIDQTTGGCIRTLHAEMNAIAWAARHGVRLSTSIMYTTISPCLACAKAIITSGIHSLKYLEKYRDLEPLNYLEKAGVEIYPFQVDDA
jgi:dCMP deaminase